MVQSQSLISAYWQILVDYLEDNAAPYKNNALDGDITFSNISDLHNPQQNPKGGVFLVGREYRDVSSLDAATGKDIRFEVRLMVSSPSDAFESLLVANDWLEWLIATLEKLRETGITTTTRGFTIRNAFQGCKVRGFALRPTLNQDDTLTTALTAFVYCTL